MTKKSMKRNKGFSSMFPEHSSIPRFEIWFSVVIDSLAKRALWLRYTTLFWRAADEYHSAALIWASLFDANNAENHCYGVERFSHTQIGWRPEHYKFPSELLSINHLQGDVSTNKGLISWELDFTHRFEPMSHLPNWLSRANIPKTRDVVCSPFAKVNGNYTLNGEEFYFQQADGILNHLWGTQRVAQLLWIFVPTFDQDHEGWGLEIIAVKSHRLLPFIVFVTLRNGGTLLHKTTLKQMVSGKVAVRYPEIEIRAKTQSYAINVRSKINCRQITPYIYRDPDGSMRFIEQSDVSFVQCEIRDKFGPKKLLCSASAAVEFHGTVAWSNADYIDPYF